MSLAPSSPRLPSPPPPAEIQLGPKSPSMNPSAASRQASQLELERIEANAKRRIRIGTRAADMAVGPPLVPLNELDSPFQLQEHLAALHYDHTASNTQPITRGTAVHLATPPPGIDRTLWLYELCRFLIRQCNSLIVGFLFDTPPCSAATCPEMRASEWQFLCAVHEQPKSCCAIDYCCHTLDWAANVVTDPKIFPSRLVVLGDGGSGNTTGSASLGGSNKSTAVKNLVNVFRRLHRIFAHAWFQHRGVFWSTESQTGLYVFFKTVCDMYDLLPAENYKLPPEAEGLDQATPNVSSSDSAGDKRTGAAPQPPSSSVPTAIMKPHHTHPPPPPPSDGPNRLSRDGSGGATHGADDDETTAFHSVGRTNTRRHIRSSPSTGSAVTTVVEADEEDGGSHHHPQADVASRLRELHISGPELVEEEDEEDAETVAEVESDPAAEDVPVIVEHDTAAAVAPIPPVEPTKEEQEGETSKDVSPKAPKDRSASAKKEMSKAQRIDQLARADSSESEPEQHPSTSKSAPAPVPASESATAAPKPEVTESPAAIDVADEPKLEKTEAKTASEPEAETTEPLADHSTSLASAPAPAPAEEPAALSSTSIHDWADDSGKSDSSREAAATPEESDVEEEAGKDEDKDEDQDKEGKEMEEKVEEKGPETQTEKEKEDKKAASNEASVGEPAPKDEPAEEESKK